MKDSNEFRIGCGYQYDMENMSRVAAMKIKSDFRTKSPGINLRSATYEPDDLEKVTQPF